MADERTSDTETVLLDAALAEVLAHGIRRTTASDIARRGGVSRQTLYRYWPDAQALFAALITRELIAVLPSGGRAVVAGCTGRDELVDTADRIRALPSSHRLRDTDPELFARYILERLGTSQRGDPRRAGGADRARSGGGLRPRRRPAAAGRDGAAHRPVRHPVGAARGGVAAGEGVAHGTGRAR